MKFESIDGIEKNDTIYFELGGKILPAVTDIAGTEKDSNLNHANSSITKAPVKKIIKERSNFYGSFNANSFLNYANYQTA